MVTDYTFDLNDNTIVVEWTRSTGSTRLLDIMPGDVLSVNSKIMLTGSMMFKYQKIEDWGTNKGVHAYDTNTSIVLLRDLLKAWHGVWL